jgi:hypothetical protein
MIDERRVEPKKLQGISILRKLPRSGIGIEPEGPSEETPRRKDIVFLFGAEGVVDQVLRKSAEAVVDLQQRSPFEEKLLFLLRHRNVAEIRGVVRAVGSRVGKPQEATYARIRPPMRRRQIVRKGLKIRRDVRKT